MKSIKTDLKLLKSSFKLSFLKTRALASLIIITFLLIALILQISLPKKYESITEILIKGNIEETDVYTLKSVLRTNQFFEKALEESQTQNKNIDLDKNSYKEWIKTIEINAEEKGNLIHINVKREKKEYALNQTKIIQDLLTSTWTQYIGDQPNANIVVSTEAKNIPSSPINQKNLIVLSALILSILIPLVIIYTKFILIFQKKINQRSKYLKYIKQKNKPGKRKYRQKRKFYEKPKLENTTEEEVKDKLNKLISGEEIFSQPENHNSTNSHSN